MHTKECLGIAVFAISRIFAGTIATSYGPGGTFIQGIGGWATVNPSEIAYPFTVPSGSDYTFDSASLALADGIGPDNSTFVILASNAGGIPGLSLETFFVTELGPSSFGGASVAPTIVDSNLHPVLTGGSIYWLILAPPPGNGAEWLTGQVLTNPDLQARFSGGSWTASPLLYGYNGPGAFSVDATQVAATPEIADLPAVACGLGLFLLIRRRAHSGNYA